MAHGVRLKGCYLPYFMDDGLPYFMDDGGTAQERASLA